jgi:preprotein translocase subunit SecG
MGLYIVVSILVLIVCVLLILVVLVQNPKGGGLSSAFGASNQFMGVRKTTDFLEKATWTLAIVLLVLSISSVFIIPRNQTISTQSEAERMQSELPGNVPVQQQPAAPAAPAENTPVE